MDDTIFCEKDGMKYVLSSMNETARCANNFLPHPPARSDKKLLRRTHSNPEGSPQVNHLPALSKGKTPKMAVMPVKPNDYNTGLNGIPENNLQLAETSDNILRGPMDRHKKLERSQTAPVTFLRPLMKNNCVERLDEQRTKQTRRRINASEVKELCKSTVTRVLPSGRRITSRQNQSTSHSPTLRQISSKEDNECKSVLIRKESDNLYAAKETKTEKAKELTYLAFANERQEDNRI